MSGGRMPDLVREALQSGFFITWLIVPGKFSQVFFQYESCITDEIVQRI
jgi:hypothetical protein